MPEALMTPKEAILKGQDILKTLHERLPGFHIEGTWVPDMPCYKIVLYNLEVVDEGNYYSPVREEIELELVVDNEPSWCISYLNQELDESEIPSQLEIDHNYVKLQKERRDKDINYICGISKVPIDEIIDFYVMLATKFNPDF